MEIVLRFFKRFILLLWNLFISAISILVPKTDEIVIVGGWFGQRFADNSKYFYLYANANKELLELRKVIWITRSKVVEEELKCNGYEVYRVWSLKSIWYHLRAKVHLIDQSPMDINSLFSVRCKRINLWHGFPLKKIGTYMENDSIDKKTKLGKWFIRMSIRGFWGDHYILATSNFSSDVLGKAFNLKDNRIIVSGYPRNYETLVAKPINYIPQNEIKYYKEIDLYKARGYKIIGYLPTFRDKRQTMIFGTDSNEKLNYFLDFCEESKIKIVGKFHFAGKNDKFGAIQNHEAFINFESDSDVYTFLNQFDVLITDYSSIYFDFLLLGKPIIFFPYDLEYYRDEDRGLIFDYEEYTPGPKVFNLDQLKDILTLGIETLKRDYENEYQKDAQDLEIKIFGNAKDMGIEHLINQIKNIDN